jgi:6-phosphogluconolactonase
VVTSRPTNCRSKDIITMLTRRAFGFGMTACIALGATTALASPARDLVYIGMHGSEITAARFDATHGTLSKIGPVASVARPTWAVAHPTLPILYSVNEQANGTVLAFTVNPVTGALTKLSEVDSGGGGTTNLWLDRPSMTLLAANYGGGSVSTLPIRADGSLATLTSTNKATGSGPSRRQQSPHAHSVTIDPSGTFALVADLGADRIFVYPFDRATHALGTDDTAHSRHFVAAPGSGPRHMAFHPGGRFLYLLNELTAEIQAFAWDATRGRLTLVETLSTNSPGFSGEASAAEVAVSQDGRFVYASNRGESTLLAYRVNRTTGRLTLIQRLSAEGELPWSFALHRSGHWMLVANERTNTVNVFRITPATGRLSATTHSIETTKPVSITIMP